MCGICGIRRFGPLPIQEEQVKILLLGNERRGTQATGVAFQQADGSVQVYKDDEPANRFVLDQGYLEFVKEHLKSDTLCVLGHTRAATKGHPSVNKNNHPMFDGKTAVVHNGVLYNDDQLFREMHLDRVADTDSDIFRAILSKNGFSNAGVNALNRINGSAAIAAVSTEFPGKLFLARSGNPIVLATNDSQHLLWSSEKQPIYDAMRPWEKRLGIWFRKARADYYFTNFPNDTSWLIGDQPLKDKFDDETWIEWHTGFKTAQFFRATSYNVHENYATKRGTKKVKLVQCPNAECKTGHKGGPTLLQLTEAQARNVDDLVCSVCKTPLKGKK